LQIGLKSGLKSCSVNLALDEAIKSHAGWVIEKSWQPKVFSCGGLSGTIYSRYSSVYFFIIIFLHHFNFLMSIFFMLCL